MGFLSAFQKKPLTDPVQSTEKFSGLIARFLEKAALGGGPRDRSITLIARSPAMAAARALTLNASEIERQQISVQVVFAKLAPAELLGQLASALGLIDQRHPAAAKVRFIKNAALLDAHEQLVLGSELCWTGDMLRRCDENRNRLDILEEGLSGPIRLAELSFNAIWAVAKPVPARALTGHPMGQPFASLNPAFAAAGLAGDKTPAFLPGGPIHTRH
jgi:hypothetical protein